MPRVPQQMTTEVRQEPVSAPRLGAEAFGLGQAQQMGQAAQAVGQIGTALVKRQEEISKVKAREAINYLLPDIDKDFNDLQAANKGSLATPDKLKEFDTRLGQKLQAQIKTLPKQAQAIVRTDIDSRKAQYAMAWNDYSKQQLDIANKDSLTVENARLAGLRAEGKETDELGVPISVQIRQNLKGIYGGRDEAVLDSEEKKIVGKAAFDKALAISQTDPKAASEIYQRNREAIDSFNSVEAANFDARLQKSVIEQDATDKAIAAVQAGKTMEDVYKEASKLPVEQRDAMLQKYAVAKEAQQAEANRVIGTGYSDQQKFILGADVSTLVSYKAPPTLPVNVANSLEALARTKVAAVSGQKTATNFNRYRELKILASQSPATFATMDLSQEALADTELKELTNAQVSVFSQGAAGAPDSSLDKAIGNSLALAGIKDDEKANAGMYFAMTNWRTNFEKEKGRKPSEVEVNAEAKRMVVKEKIGFMNERYRFELVGQGAGQVQVGDTIPFDKIPEADRKQLQEHLTAYSSIAGDISKNKATAEKLYGLMLRGEYNTTGSVPMSARRKIEQSLISQGITPTNDAVRRVYLDEKLK